ncbi:MAG: hypothetical protein ACJ0Q1_03730 [Luminiphilus sp.]
MNRPTSRYSGASSRTGPSAVQRLQGKLQQARRYRAREAFFALRIIPVLAAWAGLLAAVGVVAGALIPPGVSLTVFFSGSALLVLWLERRARLTIE